MEQDYYQSYQYWFEDQNQLDEVNNYGEGYYLYQIIENFIPKLKVLSEGSIVMMGSHNCVSLNKLCEMYGKDRCCGFDLYNPTQHERVIIKDCNLLSDEDNLPIALSFNDMGNFPKTPELKLHTQRWLAKNTMVGGIVVGRNNFNSRKIDMEGLMKSYGFDNLNFTDLDPTIFPIEKLEEDVIKSHMFSIRRYYIYE